MVAPAVLSWWRPIFDQPADRHRRRVEKNRGFPDVGLTPRNAIFCSDK